jgi:hypothetical protein
MMANGDKVALAAAIEVSAYLRSNGIELSNGDVKHIDIFNKFIVNRLL